MKRLIEIVIGEYEGEYFGVLSSSVDGQKAQVKDANARVCCAKVLKLAQKKLKQLKNFPLPTDEPSRIIQPNGVITPPKGAPNVIVPMRG